MRGTCEDCGDEDIELNDDGLCAFCEPDEFDDDEFDEDVADEYVEDDDDDA